MNKYILMKEEKSSVNKQNKQRSMFSSFTVGILFFLEKNPSLLEDEYRLFNLLVKIVYVF